MEKEYKGRIIVDNKIHFGKPCIAGTRITVEDVLELIRDGIPFQKIVDEYYPDLQIDDVKACVEYVLDMVRSEDIHLEVV